MQSYCVFDYYPILGSNPDKVMKSIAEYTGEDGDNAGQITPFWLGGWSSKRKSTPGTTVMLLGLRDDRAKYGWGLSFPPGMEDEESNLVVDRLHEDGVSVVEFDKHPIGREPGRLPSTDWSFRDFLSVMFLKEGKKDHWNKPGN
jgi:hypothetical protein